MKYLLSILCLFGISAQANSADGKNKKNVYTEEVKSDFELIYKKNDPRNLVFPPLFSFILPGLDQWVEGQFGWAAIYSGTALGGTIIASQAARAYNSSLPTSLESQDDLARLYFLGLQIYQVSGGFSAYHSFRSAVRSRIDQDEFHFLKYEESPGELFLAPWKFKHFKKWTSIIPISVVVGLMATITLVEDSPWNGISLSDTFFATSFSVGAGTHEEAVFRGWIMPMSHHYFNENHFWSNTFTAALFAGAHYPQVQLPITQFVLGWYLGWLVQKREWTLEEAIFIHTWWDIVAFLGSYAYASMHPGKIVNARLNLPLANW